MVWGWESPAYCLNNFPGQDPGNTPDIPHPEFYRKSHATIWLCQKHLHL